MKTDFLIEPIENFAKRHPDLGIEYGASLRKMSEADNSPLEYSAIFEGGGGKKIIVSIFNDSYDPDEIDGILSVAAWYGEGEEWEHIEDGVLFVKEEGEECVCRTFIRLCEKYKKGAAVFGVLG